ncbi:MAG: leucyl/phenylalanyl-tRNA--protein transferase [Rhodocyclaceae bacterium]|nr:leucyl/phenylalanyl-tRNA--protein transferase [Rhodocyclaceae bacterium]
MIPWLDADSPFPPVSRALTDPNGLLAAGADLSPARLLDAYRHGIFPWYAEGEPILWWSPDPRMVLFPAEVRITRSLAKRLRRSDYEVHLDRSCSEVIAACGATRRHGAGTWITPQMLAAYSRLHKLGYVHSVETWIDGKLAGGLYGVAIGRAFYGESMFTRATDASKIALAHLARYLEMRQFAVIDCQMTTAHLASLGGREIDRAQFVRGLATWTQEGAPAGLWPMADAKHMFR